MIKTDINCYLLPCRISLYESNLARGITVCRYEFYVDIFRQKNCRIKVRNHFYHMLVNMILYFTHMNSVVAFSWFSKKCSRKTHFNIQWPLLLLEKLPSPASQAKQHQSSNNPLRWALFMKQ